MKGLADRFGDLRALGQGYIEVRLPDREFPTLTLAFRGDHAVVHLMSAPERMSLLAGDGTVPPGAEFEVPVMDDLAVFMGDFVVGVDRAWGLVHDFARRRAAGAPGEWCEL